MLVRSVLFAIILYINVVSCSPVSFRESASCFPPTRERWTTLADIKLHPRQEHSTVTTDPNTIYVIGGIFPSSDGLTTSTVTIVQRYSIPHGTWDSVAHLPIPLNHPNAAVIDGRIYVIGGLSPDEENIWSAVRKCYVYDPRMNTWGSLPDIPAGRETGAAAVSVKGTTVYLSGGLSSINPVPGGAENSVGTVSSVDVVSWKWKSLFDLPLPRDHAASALIDSTIFVIGGRAFGHNNVVDTVFALDLSSKSQEWTAHRARMPTARGGVASAVVNGKIIVFGGEGNPATGLGVNGTGIFDQTEAYNPKEDTWETLEPMLHPRHGTSAISIGRKVYIPGGGHIEGVAPVSTFDYFEERNSLEL
ncbi:hypothetical protein IFR05_014928 [Cadophora sp. M221]|nr:hypothetical protein IFR05_014928 [Cadophora sp. M221]